MRLTSNKAITDLGGTGAVASALGLSASTVSTWRERGIPPRRWLDIAQLAESKGCQHITLEALASASADNEVGT